MNNAIARTANDTRCKSSNTKGIIKRKITPPELMTLNEVVKFYGVSLWFWRTQVWRGNISFIKKSRTIYLHKPDILAFIERNKEKLPTM